MIELLKAFSWPIAIVACVIFVCIYFRRQVSSLLDRTTSLGKDGLRTATQLTQITQEVEGVNQAQELMNALVSPVLLEREKLIRKDLNGKGLDGKAEAMDVLIRYLAVAQLVVAFEDIYRVIFGSQIYLLRLVNENRVLGLPEDAVQEHFSQVQRRFAPAFNNLAIDGYLHFLIQSHLLIKSGNNYVITNFGVEFLEWVVKIGLQEDKGL